MIAFGVSFFVMAAAWAYISGRTFALSRNGSIICEAVAWGATATGAAIIATHAENLLIAVLVATTAGILIPILFRKLGAGHKSLTFRF